jgi:hypothetical protein
MNELCAILVLREVVMVTCSAKSYIILSVEHHTWSFTVDDKG